MSSEVGATNNIQEDSKTAPTILNSDFDDLQGGLERNRDTRKSLTFGGFQGNLTENNADVKQHAIFICDHFLKFYCTYIL